MVQVHAYGRTVVSTLRMPRVCADALASQLKRELVDHLAFAWREWFINLPVYGALGVLEQKPVGFFFFFVYWHKYPLFDYFDRNQSNQCSEHSGLLLAVTRRVTKCIIFWQIRTFETHIEFYCGGFWNEKIILKILN